MNTMSYAFACKVEELSSSFARGFTAEVRQADDWPAAPATNLVNAKNRHDYVKHANDNPIPDGNLLDALRYLPRGMIESQNEVGDDYVDVLIEGEWHAFDEMTWQPGTIQVLPVREINDFLSRHSPYPVVSTQEGL